MRASSICPPSGRRSRGSGQGSGDRLGRSTSPSGDSPYDLVMVTTATPVVALDGRLITALAERPRAGILELARVLGVARGTVQARLDRLQSRGIVTGFGPDLDLVAMGYEVEA